MALVNTGLVDDNFKVIKVITGKKNEDELIVEVEKLKGSTNESKISVANVYYEVVNEKVNNVEEDGKVTLQFDDSDPFLTLLEDPASLITVEFDKAERETIIRMLEEKINNVKKTKEPDWQIFFRNFY